MVHFPQLNRWQSRGLLVACTVAALAVFALGMKPAWGAPISPPPVTDYANYPDPAVSLATEGCSAEDLTGVSFALNDNPPGSTPRVPTLGELGALHAGDVVTFIWRGVPIECIGSHISLVIKASHFSTFHSEDNQSIVDWVTAVAADRGFGTLDLTLPPLDVALGCDFQLDAIVGIPLAVVGPTGSYYSAISRGDTKASMLVNATNGAYDVCVAVAEAARQPVDTTTTTQLATTTTQAEAPTTTVAATTSTTVASTTTTWGGPAELAATGDNIALLRLLGMAAVLVGAVVGVINLGLKAGRRGV